MLLHSGKAREPYLCRKTLHAWSYSRSVVLHFRALLGSFHPAMDLLILILPLDVSAGVLADYIDISRSHT